ncbi:MAG: glycine cleavage system protein GcvH [Euryarchaeota archaeon]|nr:glycine cleavage system protein GcvH [Euryarchaeota archaeon]
MAEVPDDLKYSRSHEWVRVKDGIATIGITDHAQNELTDIVYVELPNEGDSFEQEDEFGVVESVKSVSELYLPVTGEITAVNTELENKPELINESPYDKGWLVKVKLEDESELDGLMTPNAYLSLTGN